MLFFISNLITDTIDIAKVLEIFGADWGQKTRESLAVNSKAEQRT